MEISNNSLFAYVCVFFLGCTGAGWANDQVEATSPDEMIVSRYVTVLLSAEQAEKTPLAAIVNLSFNNNTVSVLGAITGALVNSGYRLAEHHPDKRVNQLFALPLPQVHRKLGPMKLSTALSTLTGEPWELVIDPINRLITFQLPGDFNNAPVVYSHSQDASE